MKLRASGQIDSEKCGFVILKYSKVGRITTASIFNNRCHIQYISDQWNISMETCDCVTHGVTTVTPWLLSLVVIVTVCIQAPNTIYGSLYVCLVTCLVTCLVRLRVVISHINVFFVLSCQLYYCQGPL